MSPDRVGASRSSATDFRNESEAADTGQEKRAGKSSVATPLVMPMQLGTLLKPRPPLPLQSTSAGSSTTDPVPTLVAKPRHAALPERLKHAQATKADAPATESPSLKARMAGALSSRQVAFSAVLPGTGRTINRPLREDMPAQPSLAASSTVERPPTDSDPVVADAHALSKLAQAMLTSLRRPEAALWERPAPSSLRRTATKVVPWLKPASLADIASFSDKSADPSRKPLATNDNTPAQQRAEIVDGAQALLQQVDQRREALDRAANGLSRAQRERDAAADALDALPPARPGLPSPHALARERLATARKQLKIANHELDTASQNLHRLIHGTDFLALTSLSDRVQQSEQSMAFSLKRLADLKASVYAIRSTAYDRRSAIELEMRTLSEQRHTLMSLDMDLTHADQIATEAQTRIDRLKARLATVSAAVTTAGDADTDTNVSPRKVRSLQQKIRQTQGVLDEANAEKQRCEQRLEHVGAEFAQINERIAELMQQRVHEDRRWRAAGAAVDPLLKASLQLAERQQKLSPDVDASAQADSTATPDVEKTDAPPSDLAALEAVHARFTAHQNEAAHAFGPKAPQALKAQWATLAASAAAPGSGNRLPPFTVVDIASTALADVTHTDPERAIRALQAIRQHPPSHWADIAQRSGALPDRTTRDVMALYRKMATLPRGTEMLHLLATDGSTPPDASRSQAMRVFWHADDAQQSERDPAVAGWLQQAKNVAHATLSPAAPEAEAEANINDATEATEATEAPTFDDVDHAAYNAVRNGYISNAPGSPYAQHNARMMKAITEWVIRVAASGAASTDDADLDLDAATTPSPSRWRKLVPNLEKSPYGKMGLKRSYDVGDSMGMQSPRRQVDRAVRRRIDALERTLAAAREAGDGATPTADIVAAQAVVDHLKLLEQRGRHLSQVKLDAGDAKAIRRRLSGEAHERRLTQLAQHNRDAVANGTPAEKGVLRKAAPAELPPFFDEACGSGLTAYELLNRVDEHLQESLPATARDALAEASAASGTNPGTNSGNDTEEDLAAAIRLLKTQQLSGKTDIVTLFKPFILGSHLRDRLRLGGGGTLGLGLPSLPYGSASPIASPIFTAEMSRSDEAFVQLFMPILGMEMSFGKARTVAKEATVGVAVGPQVAPGVSLQGTLTARVAQQHTTTSSTLMRFFRSRHKDDEMRNNMLNALDSMVRWDLIEPQQGRRFDSPLEAIFARNPAVSISQVDGVADTTTLSATVSARLPSARFNDPHNVAQTLRVEPSAFVETERTRDRRTEQGGHISVVGAKGDTAQQRAGVGVTVGAAPLSNQPEPLGHEGHAGEIQRESVPLQVGITRDTGWALERHEISPFLIDNKQDADLDRHYSTPKDLLAEISGNRDQWLMRCIETLEPDSSGEKDNRDNRIRAATLLENFERDIEKLGETTKYCQYNVNYSMKGQPGAWIDGYRALGELARQRGDTAGMQHAQEAIDDILLMRGTWRPLMLIVRERARDSTTVGWRSLLRWQRIVNVDGQRTAAQYPPP